MPALTRFRTVIAVLAVTAACAAVAANLGPDDQQISQTGAPGTTATDAVTPAAAYESSSQRYLVVWSADETDGDFHIYGQLLTGAGGTPLGNPFRISPDGAAGSDHRQPALAADPTRGRFLVVWSGDGAHPGAYEIQGRLVSNDGALIGPAVRLSDMGSVDTDGAFDAVTPDVIWHPDLDDFVVVWSGDDDTGLLGDGRFELYGQLIGAGSGAETGANDFRISFAGPDDAGNDVLNPSLTAQTGTDRWWVAFEGDIVDDGVHAGEIFMYGATADVPDPNGYLISQMGATWDDPYTARHPDIVWAPATNELVCVWDGLHDDGTPRAVYGQRLNPDGTLSGSRLDLSASTAPGGWLIPESTQPRIAINPLNGEWFVAWLAEVYDFTPPFDLEVVGARFDATGLPAEPDAFLLSLMDPTLQPVPGAGRPALALNTDFGSKLIAWSGDLSSTPDGEREIFTQAWTDGEVSGVDDFPNAAVFALHGASPNPFNPMTTIAYSLPTDAPVTLRIYDVAGRLVRTLQDGAPGRAGRNEVVWDGHDGQGRQASSGVYLYRLQTPDHEAKGRMTLVK